MPSVPPADQSSDAHSMWDEAVQGLEVFAALVGVLVMNHIATPCLRGLHGLAMGIVTYSPTGAANPSSP